MIVFTERNLEIHFPDGTDVVKFDNPVTHGLQCMKAVDFVVTLPDRVLFIEFKDPQDPNADMERAKKFIKEFLDGELDEALKYKYRDSFLYRWAETGGASAEKPNHYYVLIAHTELDKGALSRRAEVLSTKIPARAVVSDERWKRSIVEDCMVFNIETWNEHFPRFPVRRLSASVNTKGC